MGVLLKSIRKILVELIDRIDSGECATTRRARTHVPRPLHDDCRQGPSCLQIRGLVVISICHAPSSTVMLLMGVSRADERQPGLRNFHGVCLNSIVVRLHNIIVFI